MADQKHCQPLLCAQLVEKRHDLCPQRGIQRAGRFVGDQQFGAMGNRGGDHHPLAFPAGQPVRELIEPLVGPGKTDPFELSHQLRPRRPCRSRLHGGFLQLRPDRQMRGQRRQWLLEHKTGELATGVAQLTDIGAGKIDTIQPYRSAGYARRQSERRQAGQAFSRTRRTDDRGALARVNGEADLIDEPVARYIHRQITNFVQAHEKRSRKRSPSTVRQTSSTTSTAPGSNRPSGVMSMSSAPSLTNIPSEVRGS